MEQGTLKWWSEWKWGEMALHHRGSTPQRQIHVEMGLILDLVVTISSLFNPLSTSTIKKVLKIAARWWWG